jgi:phosphatidylglycerol:prolipoprotein diacylglycerol transferase
MFLHTWHPQPLIATIGGLQLHWYGLLLAIAALSGIGIVVYIGKCYHLDTNKLFDLALIVLVVGFIGARLYHVLNEWAYYQAHATEIWKVWNGGLALHGGLLAGAAALIFMARRWKFDGWLLADIMAPAFAVAQAIGRWGNYFNQELFGRPTGRPWGIPIDVLNRQPPYLSEQYFHPTFLYESLGLLIIASALWYLHTRRWKKTTVTKNIQYGSIALVYLALAAALRIGVETLRIDRTPIIGGLRLPILIAGSIIVFALATLFIRYRRAHAKHD